MSVAGVDHGVAAPARDQPAFTGKAAALTRPSVATAIGRLRRASQALSLPAIASPSRWPASGVVATEALPPLRPGAATTLTLFRRWVCSMEDTGTWHG